MQQAALVGEVDGPADRRKETHFVPEVAPRLTRKGAALDEAHGVVLPALVLADFVDRHDVRMIQVGGGFRLRPEAGNVSWCGQCSMDDHLERDEAIETDLPGLVDHSHAAA